jgi:hypothetical protein
VYWYHTPSDYYWRYFGVLVGLVITVGLIVGIVFPTSREREAIESERREGGR